MSAPSPEPATLADRLRESSTGRDEWRVQDPKDGAYCIAFSRHDGYSLNPEREARAWLADHREKFPTSTKAGYVVACVRVQNQAEALMQEAADMIDAMRTVGVRQEQIIMDQEGALAARITALENENQNLRSVMIAAAEEISAYWDAHCDADGYGPANLQHRLEQGIPSQYAYTAGDFARVKAERDAAVAARDAARRQALEDAARVCESLIDGRFPSAIELDEKLQEAAAASRARMEPKP